jgi:hypothetical protein
MHRLGYDLYIAQGGDVGAGVCDAMAIQAPDGLAGIHLNFLRRPPLEVLAALLGRAPVPQGFIEQERAAFAAFGAQARKGYNAEQGQSPQTIGYPLTDSPAGLAAWMLDHDADSYEKISRAFAAGQPSGGLTRDAILDNVSLYWLTNTAAPAARMYWEGARSTAAAAGHPPPAVSLPVAFTRVPGRDLPGPVQLGGKGLPQPHLLPPGRSGRALRRLGAARPVRHGTAGRVQIAPLDCRVRALAHITT